MTDRTTDRRLARDASPVTQAELAELLALFDELAQRGRRLRAAGYEPRRNWRAS
jgi:hypothetical protein